jgi:hypothetical protein
MPGRIQERVDRTQRLADRGLGEPSVPAAGQTRLHPTLLQDCKAKSGTDPDEQETRSVGAEIEQGYELGQARASPIHTLSQASAPMLRSRDAKATFR